MMLVFARKAGESFRIGSLIKVSVQKIRGNKVSMGIEAPKLIRVVRSELADDQEVNASIREFALEMLTVLASSSGLKDVSGARLNKIADDIEQLMRGAA